MSTAGSMSRLNNRCCLFFSSQVMEKTPMPTDGRYRAYTPPNPRTHTQGSNSIHVHTVFHTCVIAPSKDHARAKGSGSEKGISRLVHKGSLQFSTANVIIPFQHVMGLMLMCSGDDDKHSSRKGIMASITFECFS